MISALATRLTSLPSALALAAAITGAAAAGIAQHAKAPPAYPERDILSPFRKCDDIQAPPDAVFMHLRRMRALADDPGKHKEFDKDGREQVDDETWRTSLREVERLGLDAGILALIIRKSRNDEERGLAFYGMFHCVNVEHVFNLIGHIPGEPIARTRELAYPRAIAFLRAHIGRTWGDLTAEQKAAVNLPTPGSPVANAMGIKRAPLDADHLFQVNLQPFFQLLDLDTKIDHAQGLWFLKECFLLRRDLALAWLEPALPRIVQLLLEDDLPTRTEALGLLAAIGPKDLAVPKPDAGNDVLTEFADRCKRAMFPPIRVLSEGLMLLLPGAERDAIVAAGRAALAGNSIGDPTVGKDEAGVAYRGFRIGRVPEALAILKIPVGAIITSVNGQPVNDGPSLLQVVEAQFQTRDAPKSKDAPRNAPRPTSRGTLVVEYVLAGKSHAMEYRAQ